MGGTVKFRGAGKFKLHWEISNAPGNIAAGKSDPNRPAVLGEATHDYFNYDDANECGYGFSAHFFKKFVVIQSTTGYDTFGCFGNGVTFAGVYIKVTQADTRVTRFYIVASLDSDVTLTASNESLRCEFSRELNE